MATIKHNNHFASALCRTCFSVYSRYALEAQLVRALWRKHRRFIRGTFLCLNSQSGEEHRTCRSGIVVSRHAISSTTRICTIGFCNVQSANPLPDIVSSLLMKTSGVHSGAKIDNIAITQQFIGFCFAMHNNVIMLLVNVQLGSIIKRRYKYTFLPSKWL